MARPREGGLHREGNPAQQAGQSPAPPAKATVPAACVAPPTDVDKCNHRFSTHGRAAPEAHLFCPLCSDPVSPATTTTTRPPQVTTHSLADILNHCEFTEGLVSGRP